MKKKYVVLLDDSEKGNFYSIWNVGENGSSLVYRYAEFYGKNSRWFAFAHARMLNALPERKKP